MKYIIFERNCSHGISTDLLKHFDGEKDVCPVCGEVIEQKDVVMTIETSLEYWDLYNKLGINCHYGKNL